MVTITGRERFGNSVKIEVESDLGGTPDFYWYRYGELVEVGPRPWKWFDAEPGEVVQIEVLDDAAELPEPGYPPRFVLSWYAVDDAVRYRLDEWDFDEEEWVERTTVLAGDKDYFEWWSPILDDLTTYRWRVVPITEGGIEGDAREFEGEMVRIPAVPSVSYGYDAGTGDVTCAF